MLLAERLKSARQVWCPISISRANLQELTVAGDLVTHFCDDVIDTALREYTISYHKYTVTGCERVNHSDNLCVKADILDGVVISKGEWVRKLAALVAAGYFDNEAVDGQSSDDGSCGDGSTIHSNERDSDSGYFGAGWFDGGSDDELPYYPVSQTRIGTRGGNRWGGRVVQGW